MQTPQPIQCPHCGSTEVRLSAQPAKFRRARRYRCRKCKRHFEVVVAPPGEATAQGEATAKAPAEAAPDGAAAPASSPHARTRRRAANKHGRARMLLTGAAVVIVVVVLAVFWKSSPQGEAVAAKPAAGAVPLAGSDAASAFNRGMYFWTAGNFRESFTWFNAAAQKGQLEARYYLAQSHREGRGTVQNYRSAFEHMESAARSGHLQAQHELAVMYEKGQGVEASQEMAYAWWNIASSRGHEAATQERTKLASFLTSAQIMRAQDLTMRELAALKTLAVVIDTPGESQPTP